jgi:hypothetical protein
MSFCCLPLGCTLTLYPESVASKFISMYISMCIYIHTDVHLLLQSYPYYPRAITTYI